MREDASTAPTGCGGGTPEAYGVGTTERIYDGNLLTSVPRQSPEDDPFAEGLRNTWVRGVPDYSEWDPRAQAGDSRQPPEVAETHPP